MSALNERDLITDEAFKAPGKLADEFDKPLKKMEEFIKIAQRLEGTFQKAKGPAEVKKGTEELSLAQKELVKVQKQIEVAQARNNKEYAEAQKRLIALKAEQQRKNKETKEEVILASQQTGLYQKLSARLNDLRTKYKEVALSQGQNSKEARKLRDEAQKLDKTLKGLDSNVGQHTRNVGNYSSALSQLPGPIGFAVSAITQLGTAFRTLLLTPVGLAVTALAGFVATIGAAIGKAKSFQSANAELAGVLGVTRAEIGLLQEDAKRLGASTAFTAEQVVRLQIEYAKLGFSQQKIVDLTESTINLSIASKQSANDVAAFVGATLNQFGLASTEAARVADVAAKSFAASALDFESLNTALAVVGPVASKAGVSLEETIALLGKLSDAGIDASTAGTGLRNIFLDLAGSGQSFDSAMQQILTSTNPLNEAFQLFGKRGATVATVLAQNQDGAKILTDILEDAGGAAKSLADEQLNTLEGSLTLLSSAWDGLLLSIEDGEGVFIKVAKAIVDGLAAALNQVQLTIKSINIGFKIMKIIGEDISNLFSKIWDDPAIAFQAFIDFLRTNVSVRLEAFKNITVKLFAAISEAAKLNFTAAKQELEGIGEDFKRLAVGLTEMQETGIAEYLNSVAKRALEADKNLKGFGDAAESIQPAIDGAGKKVRNLVAELIRLRDQIKKMATESFEEIIPTEGFIKTQKFLNDNIESLEKAAKEQLRLRQQLNDDELAESQRKFDEEKALRERKLDEAFNQYQEFSSSIINLTATITESRLQQIEQEMMAAEELKNQQIARYEEQEQAGIITKEQSAQARARAEEVYNEKLKALEAKRLAALQRQARFEKAIAITQALINTAQGVTKTIAQFGLPIAIPFIAATIATGAAQVAAIASQPIPQYAEGTESAKRGLGLWGEAGPEMKIDKRGNIEFAYEPTLTDFSGGETVLNPKDTINLLRAAISRDVNDSRQATGDDRLLREMSKGFRGLNRTIRNKKEHIIQGQIVGYHKSGTRVRKLNAIRNI